MAITVVKRNGEREPYDANKINLAIEHAAAGLDENITWVTQIASELEMTLFDGITTQQLEPAVGEGAHLIRGGEVLLLGVLPGVLCHPCAPYSSHSCTAVCRTMSEDDGGVGIRVRAWGRTRGRWGVGPRGVRRHVERPGCFGDSA